MKRILAAALMLAVFSSPAFAAKKPHKPHQKYDYRYHKPKYKVPKSHNHQSHHHDAGASQPK